MARVLGMGYAVVERTVRLPYGLGELGFHPGDDRPMRLDEMELLLSRTISSSWVESAGGSVVNTLRGLAGMGLGVGFIGKVGSDSSADHFYRTLHASGVTPMLLRSPARTGYRFNLVDDRGACARGTFLAAAATLNSNDLSPQEFRGFDVFHLEGSSVSNHALFTRALSIAQDARVRVSFDMGVLRVIDAHREFLHQALPGRVWVLFANEDEARAFTGHGPHEALRALSSLCPVVIIKRGAHGSIAVAEGAYVEAATEHVAVLERSGAGDLFNAGVLHALSMGAPIGDALSCGSHLACLALGTHGPHLERVTARGSVTGAY